MRIRPTAEICERGSALVEFVLCFALFWVPLFFGTLQIGFSLIREIQVTQVCRDAAHMFAFGTDFSQPAAQTLLSDLAPGLGIVANGRGVVVFSSITYVDAAACTAGGYSSTSTCPNYQKAVFTRRITVPSTSSQTGTFGDPKSIADSSTGYISAANYTTSSSAVANGFLNLISINSSTQICYVAETFVKSTDFKWWSLFPHPTIAARFIF